MLFNVQSNHSFYESTMTIEQYVQTAKSHNYHTIGLADINRMTGLLKFYQSCQKENMKALMGMKLQLASPHFMEYPCQIQLYAKSKTGFQQLNQLSYLISQPNRDEISSYLLNTSFDLIAIIDTDHSDLGWAIRQNQTEAIQDLIQMYLSYFSQENLYLGVSAYPFNQPFIKRLKQVSAEYHLPLIANQTINMTHASEKPFYNVLQAMKNNQIVSLDDIDEEGAYHLYKRQEFETMYKLADLEECVKQAEKVGEFLNVSFELNRIVYPKYPLEGSMTASQLLNLKMTQGLIEKNLNHLPQYLERAQAEYLIISQMGFSDYFLIVSDLVDFCQREGIQMGPGRGSVAGSLIAYLLGITQVDSLKYNLLFERFLNPERISMPDIDLDVPSDQRDRILGYLGQKYGHDHISAIGAISIFGKNAKNEMLKTLNVSDQFLNQSDSRSKSIRQMINRLANFPKNTTKHAAGIIIHESHLLREIPLFATNEEYPVSQWDKDDIETMGLLKFDLLSVHALKFLGHLVSKSKQEDDPNFMIENINYEDPKVIELFTIGRTVGIFHYERESMLKGLKLIQPGNFEEIALVSAAIRPGVSRKNVQHYLNRKFGSEEIPKIHPIVDRILESTFGIIFYEEQIMLIFQELADFSLGQADIFRKAIKNKNNQQLKDVHKQFIQNALAKGMRPETVDDLYQQIIQFAEYGFNKAHAVAYTMLSYQQAYFKVYHPLVFYSVLLNDANYKVSITDVIWEIKLNKIPLKKLDINLSDREYQIENKGIRVGFKQLKGLSSDLIKKILNERKMHGPFQTFESFIQRIVKAKSDYDSVEKLIKAGAFDSFQYNRATLIKNLQSFIDQVEYIGSKAHLFGIEIKITSHQEFTHQELIHYEIETLGYSIQPHPFEKYRQLKKWQQSIDYLDLLTIGQTVLSLFYIQKVHLLTTKNNKQMARIEAMGVYEPLTMIAFPEIFNKYRRKLKEGQIVEIAATYGLSPKKEKQLIINRVLAEKGLINQDSDISDFSRCFIKLEPRINPHDAQVRLLKLATQHPGPCQVILVDTHKKTFQLDSRYNLGFGYQVRHDLSQFFGDENVVFQ